MTRMDKSEAQFDAEAEGRRLAAIDLHATIALHRELFRDECRIPRLVSRQPPIVSEEDGQRRAQFSHTGMPTSGLLHRRVFEKRPGEMFPWVTAFAALRVDCRRNHRASHTGYDRPYWRGSLCHEAVRLCVIGMRDGPLSPESAALVLHLPNLDDVLPGALAWLERHIDEQRARAEQRAKVDAGVFRVGETLAPMQHHAVPGTHAAECPHPECRARRAAA